jgi:E3 SUMO-protein ligase RanBP2
MLNTSASLNISSASKQQTADQPDYDDEAAGNGGNGNPEEYEPDVDFKPIVKLHEVEVKTGEEDEAVLFKQRCKLFKFDSEKKEWKEKGVGEMKLLKHRQTQSIRVLMRRDQVLKLCANHKVSAEMKLTELAPKQLSWLAMDFSDSEPRTEMLLAKFRSVEEAAEFRSEFEKAALAAKNLDRTATTPMKKSESSAAAIKSDKPSLSQALKTDNWSCTGCYAPNKREVAKCACCGGPRPGITASFTSPALSTVASSSANKSATPASPSSVPAPQMTESKSQPFSFGLSSSSTSTANQSQGMMLIFS